MPREIRPGRPIRIDREVIKDPFAAQGNFDHRALPTLIASLQKQKRFKVIIEGRRQGFSRAGSAATHGARPTGSSEGPLEHGSSFGEFAGQYAASRNEQITEGVPSYRITFNDRLNPTERFITIAHELGHIFLGPLENVPRERAMTTRVAGLIEDRLARNEKEIEAEAVAYLVASRAGVVPASAQYIKDYATGPTSSVTRCDAAILQNVRTHLAE